MERRLGYELERALLGKSFLSAKMWDLLQGTEKVLTYIQGMQVQEGLVSMRLVAKRHFMSIKDDERLTLQNVAHVSFIKMDVGYIR